MKLRRQLNETIKNEMNFKKKKKKRKMREKHDCFNDKQTRSQFIFKINIKQTKIDEKNEKKL